MTTTTNLGLTTYNTASGSETLFLAYRLAMADTASNMFILDDYAGGVSASIVNLRTNSLQNVTATLTSPNTFVGVSSLMTSYYSSLIMNVIFDTEIGGTTTININSIGNAVLKKLDLQGSKIDLVSGDLLANFRYWFMYDGTHFVLMNSSVGGQVTVAGTPSNFISISASNVLQDSGTPILSGVTTGSFNKVVVDAYGRVTSASVVDYQEVSSIAGSTIMTDTTGSVVKHDVSGVVTGSYTKVEVDLYGHVTSASYVDGMSGSVTFYSASATGGAVTLLNTVVMDQGLITSWSQA